VVVVLLAIEGGLRMGQYRSRRSEQEDRPSIGEVVAATAALLAFMLGFRFGLAASCFDVRRGLVIDEAKAIGTTFLRGWLLPEPRRTEVRTTILRASVRQHRSAQRSDRAVAEVVLRSLVAAGEDALRFAGHPLRARPITRSAMDGVSERTIHKQSRHMSRRHIRDGSLCSE
jgi:hypothetical protein